LHEGRGGRGGERGEIYPESLAIKELDELGYDMFSKFVRMEVGSKEMMIIFIGDKTQ